MPNNPVLVINGKKRCSECKKNKYANLFYKNHKTKSGYQSACKECIDKRHTNYVSKNRERVRNIGRLEIIRNGANRRKRRIDVCRKIRLEVINAYGNKCTCCGEHRTEFMTLEHLNGGGGYDRQKLGARGVYYKVKKLRFPKEFTILCMNCNFSKRFGKTCPHETERLGIASKITNLR